MPSAKRSLATALLSSLLTACVGSASHPPARSSVPQLEQDSLDRYAHEITLRVRNSNCVSVGVGSAVAIGNGLLLTNRHVVEGADELQISTWDGRDVTVRVADEALAEDLALVRISPDAPADAEVDATDPQPGDRVTAVGFPEGGELTFSGGTVVDYVDGTIFDQALRVMRTRIPLRPGNSGGPVLNEHGELVGVAFAIEKSTGFGLVIPISSLRTAVNAAIFSPVQGTCSG